MHRVRVAAAASSEYDDGEAHDGATRADLSAFP